MNYVKINNNDSRYIRGLIIQSVPPITKPKMRYSAEEIDGRDGDIVTTLGYSAYEKKFKIGLHGGYDIDGVISFFDASGKITFSNEPDKYYNFQQLEQIDFERLVRYREAEVSLHVQPFKYPVADGEILKGSGSTSAVVTNRGNIYSRPRLEFNGSGTVNVSLNGTRVLTLSLDGDMVIDCERMEAYNDNGLLNRMVSGDYSNFTIKPGASTVSWDGSVSSVSISRYERWI